VGLITECLHPYLQFPLRLDGCLLDDPVLSPSLAPPPSFSLSFMKVGDSNKKVKGGGVVVGAHHGMFASTSPVSLALRWLFARRPCSPFLSRENSKLRRKSEKDESKRLKEFVENAFAIDPRVIKHKQEEKEERCAAAAALASCSVPL